MNTVLPEVAVGKYCCSRLSSVESFRPLLRSELVTELQELGRALAGLRVCHVNATAAGGGVAELLSRMLPIYRMLGIRADWRLIHGDPDYFTITKKIHNALQGAQLALTPEEQDTYVRHNRVAAERFGGEYDVYVVHDPQPAALRSFVAQPSGTWIWRCHIDSSAPNPEVWSFLRPHVQAHDAAVFTMNEFRPADLTMDQVAFIPPAIDPLSPKNMELPMDMARSVVAEYGISLRAPILLQVARFDPWKDPLGVIRAYRLVKASRPDVQLVLVGAMASDDPEGWHILDRINEEALGDRDLYVFTNLTGVGNLEVNAFQRSADVVVQKSLREGFGLVVSEAFWKEKPVVAGAVGGIPMQFPEGHADFLVDSPEACADRVLRLLDESARASAFGRAGKERVREHFLLPRLVLDELRLIRDLLEAS